MSDTFGNAIYRVRGDEASVLLRTPEFQASNGLRWQHGSLVVVVGIYWLEATDEPALILDNAAEGLGSSADFGIAHKQRLIAVPELTGTRVVFYELTWPRTRRD